MWGNATARHSRRDSISDNRGTMITREQRAALLKIPELKEWTVRRGFSLDQVAIYYNKFFVSPMTDCVDIGQSVLCDCAAGLGWLSFAFLLRGGKAAVLVEPDGVKFRIIQEIAEIVGVTDKCTFLNSFLQDIALADKSVDIFASIETLEHVRAANIEECVKKINDLTRRLVIVTAPNRLFPIDSHDTRLPFAHWLPKPLRRIYVSAFGKVDTDLNDYPAPWTLFANLKDFRPISRALVFRMWTPGEELIPCSYPIRTADTAAGRHDRRTSCSRACRRCSGAIHS
jgi:hypothetical protein